ncbi:MAG: formate--tetrahydrofolate ligase [Deltaproteobacteria bacterium]|nr:formate--tetrahydrofolate ligase [Deltaproteobacteria bacterium]
MESDVEIAHSASPKPLDSIARKLNIPVKHIIPYGKHIAKIHSSYLVTDVRNRGGTGGLDTAQELIELCKWSGNFKYLYNLDAGIREKIETIARKIYGADGVSYSEDAVEGIKETERLGYGRLPVCIAKTHKSLSDNPSLLGRPKGFNITVHKVLPAAGAGFIVVVCGNILLMPGLPMNPLAERIDIDRQGRLAGI